MSQLEISEPILAKMAGWEPVKQAKMLVAAGRVQSSEWQPPFLRGMVQEGNVTYRAGLKIKSATDAENLCTCRQSRQWGTICAHSVAVGLHSIRSKSSPAQQVSPFAQTQPSVKTPAVQVPKGAAPVGSAPSKSLRRAKPGEEGEPAELYLILPPSLDQALAKSKVMVCAEVRRKNGQRTPLAALPRNVPFAFSEADNSAIDEIERFADGELPSMLMLSAAQFADLLTSLKDHPRVALGKTQPVKIATDPLSLKVRGTLESNGEITLRASGNLLGCVIRGKSAWAYENRTFRPVPAGMESLLNGTLRIPRSQVPLFLNLDLPRIVNCCQWESNFEPSDFTLEQARPQFFLKLEGSLTQLQAKLECAYGEKYVSAGAGDEGLWLADPKSPTTYNTRNSAAERNALTRLTSAGFSGPDERGWFHLKGQTPVLNFFAGQYPQLLREWKVTLEEKLERNTRQNLEWVEPRYEISSSGEQWFDLNVAYNTKGGEQFSAADIQRLLLSGQSHSRLKNGKFALVDTGAVEELQEVLLDCAPRQHHGSFRLNNLHAGFLQASLGPYSRINAPSEWRDKAAQQSGEVKLALPALGALESVLRPYQKEGVAWLSFLRANGFGGILADEMGLGKTLQVLSLFASQKLEKKAPRLVVCPTSLVFNWASEAAKFTPELRVLVLQGAQRKERFAQIADHDLVITSYALLRRDADSYRGIEFDTVVLDEAQHIKNRQTQNAQAVKSIRASRRLVLTGTPIENSVLDLWSIFDFLMPGYLGTAKDFRERYEQPIVKDRNLEAQNRLSRRLRPFMLRRIKRDVASDLPEKIEQVSYCELNEDQRALYQQVLDASRKEIYTAVESNGLGKSRIVILTALLRLRQICCDLRLLNKGEALPDAKDSANPSGKVEMFGELLEEVIDGGHRVLVFSQFTTMLGLLKERLAAEDIPFCYLDGATANRAEVVGKFQSDASIPVFLISLKAGGVGLNLTAADTVIHFDPWWNPAVEAQATDRAHRIGQKRVVTSYKLITRGTVEEKILNLQNRKRELLQGMLDGEEQLTESLNWSEIQELLAG